MLSSATSMHGDLQQSIVSSSTLAPWSLLNRQCRSGAQTQRSAADFRGHLSLDLPFLGVSSPLKGCRYAIISLEQQGVHDDVMVLY